MICAQFLTTCLQPQHPSFPIVTDNSGPRNKKQTLQSRFYADVADHLQDGVTMDVGTARKEIHTRAVEVSMRDRGDNSVLGTPAPEIAEEEGELPRKTRRILAQLRSNYCSSLNDYRFRVELSDTPMCPCCRQEEHTVQHVFVCSEHQTDLRPVDLWLRPVEVAEFLWTLPFFDIPAVERPPPEPPPQPSPTSTERTAGY